MDYFVEKINQAVDDPLNVVKVANSIIFPVINRDAIKEFLRINRRNRIMQLKELIGKMFDEAKYDDIIESLEDFADTQKLVIFKLIQQYIERELFICVSLIGVW